jgi:ferredoxin-NADP reductase
LTATQLLAWISTALLLQLGFGLASALRSRREAERMTDVAPAERTPGAAPAWAGWREFRVARREFEDVAQSQCSFYLQPVDARPLPPFEPGQFLTFALDLPAVDGLPAAVARTITRCYSLSDRPDPAHYRITIKRVSAPADHPELEPGLSSGFFHDRVQVGDTVRVKAPSGRFRIDSDATVPAVLIAGGIGITPMMSMLRWCLDEQPQRALHVFYGVRNGYEHAFKRQLEALAAAHPTVRLNVVYSRPADTDLARRDYQHEGHVDVALLRRMLPHGRHRFFVCGPPAMMQTLIPALVDWGIPLEDVHYEAFGPASVRVPGATDAAQPTSVALEVQFQRSGRTLVWDGQDATLLEFAERHGVEVESGCRSGGCGSCETRLIAGSVEYAHAPDHDVATGHCLLCVGRPSSPLVLEA